MKINDLMLRDIRAEIDFEDDVIVIKNPNELSDLIEEIAIILT